jgi:hypothetical protein
MNDVSMLPNENAAMKSSKIRGIHYFIAEM